MKKFKSPKTIRVNPTFNWKPPKSFNLYTKKSQYNRFQDFDQDNVPNRQDCRPYNRHKQHIRPSQTTLKRLSLQRIYVTNEPANPYREPKGYHITSKEAKQFAPKARQQLLGIIKKYPSVLGDIERKQPKAIAYSSVPPDKTTGSFSSVITRQGKTTGTQVDGIIQIAPTDNITERMKESYESTNKLTPKDIIKEHRREAANVIFHELKHQEQQSTLGKESMDTTYKEYKQRYEENPLEIEAQAYATAKISQQDKPGKSPTGAEITKTLNLDSDFDGVPDSLDCRPFDPRLQHVTPNLAMQARLKKLPIYFTTSKGTIEQIVNARKFYSLYDKKVPKEITILKQRFYSMIKKRPEVIGELERTRPRAIFFTKRGMETLEEAGYTQVMEEPKEAIEKGKLPGQHIAVVRLSSPHRGYPYRKFEREHSAGTTIHELEHIKQYKRWEGRPKLAKKMRKGPYSKKIEEIQAFKAEQQAYKKRYKVPRTKEQIHRGFRKIMED